MDSIYSPFTSPTLQSTGQMPKQTEKKHLLWDAVRKHDLPSPGRGVLLGMESGVCAHMCVCRCDGGKAQKKEDHYDCIIDAECIVHFNGEGNFSFPPQIRISLGEWQCFSTLSLPKVIRRESHLEPKSSCPLLSLPQSAMSYCELNRNVALALHRPASRDG